MSSTDGDAGPDVGKAGRNEARKLRASWLNTVSVAFFVAAFIQPALSIVQQARLFTLVEGIASAIFLCISVALFAGAQSVVKRLED